MKEKVNKVIEKFEAVLATSNDSKRINAVVMKYNELIDVIKKYRK